MDPVPAERGEAGSPGGFRSVYRTFSSSRVRKSADVGQRYLETSSDPESQFMVGFFQATGLGGIEEDQGRVS